MGTPHHADALFPTSTSLTRRLSTRLDNSSLSFNEKCVLKGDHYQGHNRAVSEDIRLLSIRVNPVTTSQKDLFRGNSLLSSSTATSTTINASVTLSCHSLSSNSSSPSTIMSPVRSNWDNSDEDSLGFAFANLTNIKAIRRFAREYEVSLHDVVHSMVSAVWKIAQNNEPHARSLLSNKDSSTIVNELVDYIYNIVHDLNRAKEPVLFANDGSVLDNGGKRSKSKKGAKFNDNSAMGRGLRCLLVSLIYIDRISQTSRKIKINTRSAKRMIVSGLLMALKYSDDTPGTLAQFSQICAIPLNELKELEVAFCKMIDFCFFVPESLFKETSTLLLSLSVICACKRLNKTKEGETFSIPESIYPMVQGKKDVKPVTQTTKTSTLPSTTQKSQLDKVKDEKSSQYSPMSDKSDGTTGSNKSKQLGNKMRYRPPTASMDGFGGVGISVSNDSPLVIEGRKFVARSISIEEEDEGRLDDGDDRDVDDEKEEEKNDKETSASFKRNQGSANSNIPINPYAMLRSLKTAS